MNVVKKMDGTTAEVAVEGRLDTTTAPALEQELNGIVPGADKLILDFSNLEYISSAGLRLLLATQRKMSEKGGMIVRHANEMVMEVFEVSGFTELLTIE